WPGNIRELRNMVERASILCAGTIIGSHHLPVDKLTRPLGGATPAAPIPATEVLDTRPPARELKQIERDAMVDALARCHGNQSRAAQLLGMPRRTFCKRLKEHGIPRPRA